MITNEERAFIEEQIHKELVAGIAKHGDWSDYDYGQMLQAIVLELGEVVEAVINDNHHGDHGTIRELFQTAACCQKMAMQILRREGKSCKPYDQIS